MIEPLALVEFVAGVLGVAAGLLAVGEFVVSRRRGGGGSTVTRVAIGILSLAAIVVGGTVLAALAAGGRPGALVLASLAVVLGSLAAVYQRANGGPATG